MLSINTHTNAYSHVHTNTHTLDNKTAVSVIPYQGLSEAALWSYVVREQISPSQKAAVLSFPSRPCDEQWSPEDLWSYEPYRRAPPPVFAAECAACPPHQRMYSTAESQRAEKSEKYTSDAASMK